MALSHSVVPGRAATEVAPFRVGAAVIAGILGGRALIHVMAGTGKLVKGEPRGTGALVAPQGVVAGSRATGIRIRALVLIDTLIPLVMLNISLRAATSVASQDVLAAMLAPMVSITFIDIFTVQSSGIKREPSLAFTAETSRGVLTDSLCSTK